MGEATTLRMSRRMCVGAAFTAALPLSSCRAASPIEDVLAADEAKLSVEFDAIKALDKRINSLRERAFTDSIMRKKDETESLQALVNGDRVTAKRLADEAKALEADELASDKIVLALRDQETEALDMVAALKSKTAADQTAIRTKRAAVLAEAVVDIEEKARRGVDVVDTATTLMSSL